MKKFSRSSGIPQITPVADSANGGKAGKAHLLLLMAISVGIGLFFMENEAGDTSLLKSDMWVRIFILKARDFRFSHCSYRCFYPVRESHTVREQCSLTGFSDEIVKKVLGIKEEPLYIMPVGRKR